MVQAAEPEAPALPDDALTERLLEAFEWQSPNKALETIPVKVSVSAVTHTKQELTLRRPAFLQKSGMTGAGAARPSMRFCRACPLARSRRNWQPKCSASWTCTCGPGTGQSAGLGTGAPVFCQRGMAAHRRRPPGPAGRTVHYRAAGWGSRPRSGRAGERRQAPVLVQGIADVVLVFDDHAEILDYKTDKSRNATYYIESYAAQLQLYRRAFALRLPVPVTKLTIYSFAMQDEIDIPLE